MARPIPELIPITELRQDAAAVLSRVAGTRDPVVITQRGRAAAVLLSVAEYERVADENLLLRKLLAGDREAESGVGHSLDDVLADAIIAER